MEKIRLRIGSIATSYLGNYSILPYNINTHSACGLCMCNSNYHAVAGFMKRLGARAWRYLSGRQEIDNDETA